MLSEIFEALETDEERQAFPAYQSLDGDKALRLLVRLKESLTREARTWNEFFDTLERTALAIQGACASNSGFDIEEVIALHSIFPHETVYIFFPLNDHVDVMSWKDLWLHWPLIWHPLHDFLIFDESMDWLIWVWHDDGRVQIHKR